MNHSLNEQLQARRAAATPRGVGVMASFYADRAEGAELWDVEGRRYIDFAGGIAVMNVGHRHPKIVAALQEQLQHFTHTCYQVVPYESYVSLAEKLNALTPGSHAKKTALFSTGAEAVENAIKIARAYTQRPGVIAFGGAFHGRSLFAVSLTGKVQPYKAGFGPFPPEIYHAPFPCHCASLDETKKAVELLFKADIEPSRVAAIIFEPIQGEGGFNVIQAEAVKWLRALCDQHGIVLIADEVQTGFGRTGKLFAMEHFFEQTGVLPDLMTIAKSLASGMPLSAVTGRAEIMDAPAPGGLGGTYAGNPMAVAAAHAVIDVMHDEQLPARGQKLGDQLKARLDGLRAQVPQISDVRGLGAMVAVQFNDPASGKPDAAYTKAVQVEALRRGLILLTCGVDYNVVRFLFPLTISDAVFAEALDILEASLLAAKG
ncbi:GABA aminotransferase, PLP-dependent [Thiomonas arsenitoxydans]|uniref:4-aminobutyrate aminotransferase (Gamma-amino-N-butyrate transaminase) (GABA transaminase) (Glutamate:succinic semialdehyde transaminase) (GABA aminotransferase) (GABA-AT) n=1 Tax=Thiomonas arsenitoxydans (strain DSM 22701 / CIP 110005 / 3As) TaxID=426114 RepID=D6CQS2_THIA3|nr:4-aminobutyrate--2-oxoglutarate transaminase [Thiomonas arsenitoxydans]CAZ86963.1 4-aminobutyrate aminotransferase (Gamma-amino-N-butyrate transaminase) (GABA transaminase) (Glutamate:succinic semialdehyde transaminase) (GABA aminotransferase) (GABA-AT) [Thiomonas arsenitoxydans]CQR27856.1 GABA aminotransferase, PLP-dependent [Thiomonas arsenitoxydans]CQR30200.1 GABA aminotransferase, PLP-dependent [Thiomonas arsenitoxydans]CQR32174.1 GABA aminotransferase, PLP-dependent [Thiomonas arsenitox